VWIVSRLLTHTFPVVPGPQLVSRSPCGLLRQIRDSTPRCWRRPRAW